MEIPVVDMEIDTEHDDGLYVHSVCHPNAPTWVFVVPGAARVECAVCGKHVVTLALELRQTARYTVVDMICKGDH